MCIDSWFSTSGSTEEMIRGTCNEDRALSALQNKDGVHFVFETGLPMKHDETYYACFMDGVALVDHIVMGGFDGWE